MKSLPDEVGISINRLSQPALLIFRSFRGWYVRLELMKRPTPPEVVCEGL